MNRVVIETGAKNYQIFQQKDGFAEITLNGSVITEGTKEGEYKVFATVAYEDTQEMLFWWKECKLNGKKWSVTLTVPTGGPYTIKTCANFNHPEFMEWSRRGDSIFHVGVGDLFVIAGQSNSAGYSKDFAYDPAESGVHLLGNDKEWHLAVHPLQDSSFCDSPNTDGSNCGISMYLTFAKYLKRYLNYPIGLIQSALGGSTLNNWNEFLYSNMLDSINVAGGSIKAFLWHQGCSETGNETNAKAYKERFLKMKEKLCMDINNPDLPVFMFQLNRHIARTGNSIYWGVVNENIRQLKNEKNIYVIPTSDGTLSDGIHNDAFSNLKFGERLAKTVLNKLYNKQFLCNAPDIKSAEMQKDGSVILTFENIVDKIYTFECAPEMLEIDAVDSCGEVHISDFEEIFPDKLRLVFPRKLEKGAVINCSWKANRMGVVPCDYANHIPTLSFMNVKIKNL
ncbi:MAG: hypothetical protein J6A69_11650 [Clostridia bacterium]|nr:hypothetical protein [Clostridia bacterium]